MSATDRVPTHPTPESRTTETTFEPGRARGGTITERRSRLQLRMRSAGRLPAADALAAERRRIAAEVHDLVMQDLALALSAARTLATDPALDGRADLVVEAGERALAGARELVGDLGNRSRRPVIEAVRSSAGIAARSVPLTVDVHGVSAEDEPDRPTLEALVHLAREAVTNAVKHAGPSLITVALSHDDEWRLRVTDDGRGFDTSAGPRGFGLDSMQRHAEALGGTMRLVSGIGLGTTVEFSLP